MNTYRKKLIEVALPLAAINAACVEDKNRKTGHIRNLHKWFAPMPLPAWRAMLFASLVDDPSNDLDEAKAAVERARLFDILARICPLDAHRDAEALSKARAAIRASVGDPLPTVLDPFCGGGSTVLEAQRLGLPTIASDLNPVPVLITTTLCRVVPLFTNCQPVNSAAGEQTGTVPRAGIEGLLEDIRHYAAVVKERAWKRLNARYPKHSSGGTAYAWRWAWTVPSPNPVTRHAPTPLVSDWWLSKQKGKAAWLRAEVDKQTWRVRYKVETEGSPPKGTTARTGATCLLTGVPIPHEYIRQQAVAGRLGLSLLCTAIEGISGRWFEPGDELMRPSIADRPFDGIEMPEAALSFRVQQYGFRNFLDLFTRRQADALETFADEVATIHADVLSDAVLNGAWPEDQRRLEDGGLGATAYADAVCGVLGLLVGKLAQSNNVSVRWFIDPRTGTGKATPAFDRHAVPMVWDFVETNPFGGAVGDWTGPVMETALKAFSLAAPGTEPSVVLQRDARRIYEELTGSVIVACDPPYYANIGYADLSDFFFLWLRRALRGVMPRLFGTVATPKADELIASPFRQGTREAARAYFQQGFEDVFDSLSKKSDQRFPLSIVYALKQSEESDDGDASTGWDVFLSGLLNAGLSVVATWPVRTTVDTRMIGMQTNALASAIYVVCRRRSEGAPVTTRGDFRRTLRRELPAALRNLQQGNIAPVDVGQACIGPAMEVFSRHGQVLEADGSAMTVRAALQLINEVLDEYLASGEGDFDADTRFAITWYELHGWEVGPFGEAENIAKARNVSVAGVVEAGICHSGAGKVRILNRSQMRPIDYDPAADERPTIWEFTQHLIRVLEDDGEEAAARLLKKLGSASDATRELAYRLYNTCERKKWAEDARSYNGLILAWPELEKLAAKLGDEPPPAAPSKPGKKGTKGKKAAKGQAQLFKGDDTE